MRSSVNGIEQTTFIGIPRAASAAFFFTEQSKVLNSSSNRCREMKQMKKRRLYVIRKQGDLFHRISIRFHRDAVTQELVLREPMHQNGINFIELKTIMAMSVGTIHRANDTSKKMVTTFLIVLRLYCQCKSGQKILYMASFSDSLCSR